MDNEKLVITSRRPKGEDGYKVFSVRIKEETVARIDVISDETGRSRNELIGRLLEYALAHCIIEKS